MHIRFQSRSLACDQVVRQRRCSGQKAESNNANVRELELDLKFDSEGKNEVEEKRGCVFKWRPPWWNRRTRLERTLCTTTMVLFVACVALALVLSIITVQYNNFGEKIKTTVSIPEAERFTASSCNCENVGCQSRGCVQAAASLIENIDEAVKPCEDFYQFACGGWMKKRVIPEDKSGLSSFSELSESLSTKLNVLLEEKKSSLDNVEVFKKVRDMYASCMDTDTIDEENAEPLMHVIEYFGGYPVLEESWSGDDYDWINALIKMRNSGFDHDIIIDISVITDARNNVAHIIDLDQTDLGLPDRAYYMQGMNSSVFKAYFKLMVDSVVLIGGDRERATTEMMEVLNFETALANLSLPKEKRRNITRLYNKMTINDVKKLAPGIDWLKLLKSVVGDDVADNESVVVNVPNFMTNLDELLTSVNKSTLANYIMWRISLQSFSGLDKRFRNLVQEYSESLLGTKKQSPRWKQCIGRLGGCLSTAIAAIYVRNYFPRSSKDAAVELVNAVLEEFKYILNDAEWMDNETKREALAKADKIIPFIGFPKELLEDKKINDYCQPLSINGSNFFENIRSIYKFSVDYAFGKLRKPVDKLSWIKHSRAAVVNAYYNALSNSISFPAGILQGLFFNENRPKYMNFGAIGFIIGHEVTHGFDDVGRQFDKDGNNIDWWDFQTSRSFKEKAQCIIEQYGNFTVPEVNMKVNGINTQGENIADIGGLKEAYLAYKRYVTKLGSEEPGLPSLNYTSQQLFWISAAQIWCSKYTPQTLALTLISGVHSPGRFRVNGAFANQPHFAEDFKCPLDSPMNPSKKCAVW